MANTSPHSYAGSLAARILVSLASGGANATTLHVLPRAEARPCGGYSILEKERMELLQCVLDSLRGASPALDSSTALGLLRHLAGRSEVPFGKPMRCLRSFPPPARPFCGRR
jgi:hypothetical protein